MEFAVVKDPRNFGAANLLGVPGMGFSLLDSDDEKCVVVMGIVPRSSPLPRRKTSEEELEEAQQQQPAHGSRRVCFADAKGLCLVLVKEFDCWDVPKLLGYDQRLAEGQDVERYSYYLSFPSPLPTPPEELGSRVREQRIELESIELLPGTTVLRGLVRVLNVSFDKTVFVRTTLDAWASHFDLLAEYVQGSSDGATDCFSFKLTLVPPFDEQGSRVDFCLRYETSVGTFWANNNAKNYVLFCHQRVKEEGEMLQEECVCRKSCLKAARQVYLPGVSENGDTLNMNSRQVTDIYLVTSEDKCHTLTMESNRNASRKRRRRAARQAKLKELFPQRDNQPERENESEASLPEPPSDCAREGENLAESTLDSVTCSSADNQRQRYISRAQSGGSSQAEKSESVDPVDPVQPLGAERREVTATRARQPHLVDKVEQKQHFATCITGENRQKPLGSVRQSDRGSDNVCFVNSTGEESHGALSLAESTDAPVTAPSSFTFGTMVASLYPLACRQVKSENRNLADQLNPTRERSMMGDSLENSARKAQTEAEDDIQMQLNLTQTLAPTQVVQETTDPASQPHLSPFMSACENQEVHQQICCDVATGFICVDKSEEQDGIQPTVSVSTTNIYPEQGREIEQLEEICAVTFKAADISVGDNSIPEFQRCSAVDVSQETLQTSLEVAAEPDNRGNESTNNLEDGDITPTIEYEDSVSECIKVNRYSSTHPYMLGEEIELALVEKPVCTPADAEHSTVEDAASKPDYFGSYAVRTEDKNWEMMVEEEEEDALGEEVMTKEVAENGGKGREELKEEQTIAKQQALEKTVGCEKREHTETEFEGQKHVCVTEEKSKEEPFIWEEQEVEEEEVKKDADHGTDNQHDVWEDIRIEEKENLAETDRETRVPVEDKTERISADEEESSVSGAGEGGLAVVEEIVVRTAKAERNEEMERPETRWGNDSSAAENGSLIFTDELKCDPMAEKEQEEEEEEEEEEDSSSSGSPSDEEMELYIHRMRAAPSPQTLRSFPRDGGSGKGSHTGKRPSIDRPRLLSSSMPPINKQPVPNNNGLN
ncbi:unnamed protein product [Merluccius merluccius]